MSPLLRLPGEMRNRIYEDVFAGERIPPESKPQHCISLLFVSRQIHAKTALLPYRYFTFSSKLYIKTPAERRSKNMFITEPSPSFTLSSLSNS
jgi:hypothetical protein